MFSGMGMFGAFGFNPEEETKKNEEMGMMDFTKVGNRVIKD